MPVSSDSMIQAVEEYHRASTHHPGRHAPGPGFPDRGSRPDPVRSFAGAPRIPLPHVEGGGGPTFEALFGAAPPPASAGPKSLGLFLELAFGLSAWMNSGHSDIRALRNAPSSGNQHPTEAYLLLWGAEGIAPGLYHYAPYGHLIECRAQLDESVAAELRAALPGSFGALGLSSIGWRAEWQFGARAYRFCQLDVGHALGAARYAAGVLGWQLRLDPGASDGEIATLLGLDRATDFADAEEELPALLALLGPRVKTGRPKWKRVTRALAGWQGRANRLSAERVRWPEIARTLPWVEKADGQRGTLFRPAPSSPPQARTASGLDAVTVIRERRSARRLDGETGICRHAFSRILDRCLPREGLAPFDSFPFEPALDIILFAHRVEGLTPGIYLLNRSPGRLEALRSASMNRTIARTPALPDVPLYQVGAPWEAGDLREYSARNCCYQGIAGRGAFSLAMLADFRATLEREGPWAYRRLHWEAGLIGQCLHLEAAATGLSGIGIGCFFDDAIPDLLGFGAAAEWRVLYNFAIGGALPDTRLRTHPAYAHLTVRDLDG